VTDSIFYLSLEYICSLSSPLRDHELS